MMEFRSFVFNPFQENTWLAWDETKECVIIDPGCFETWEQKELTDFIEQEGLKPVMILNTHCHIDHILGNAFLKRQYNIPLYFPEDEEYNRNGAVPYAKMMGFSIEPSPDADKYIEVGKDISFGNSKLEVLFTPGHSAGHVTFYAREKGVVFSGDVLFRGSIGRVDLPGGDMDTLMQSIKEVILPLGDDIQVLSGHGPITTVGEERRTNYFLLQYV